MSTSGDVSAGDALPKDLMDVLSPDLAHRLRFPSSWAGQRFEIPGLWSL